MPKRDVHVTPHPEGGWQTKREGSERAGGRFDNQGDAIDAARETAIRERLDVVIHGRDGKIRDADSYGNDPNPPRGSKH